MDGKEYGNTRGQWQQRGFTIVELLIVVVVIAVLAAIVIVSYNSITNQAKSAAQASDLSTWKKQSEIYKVQNGIECPANYSFVYGNATLGTSDFCVMKYEAKIQGNDNGQTTYNASMVAESRPTGTPWVNITQPQAIAASSAACTGCHLITEAEWMTIAADVLSVKYNWSGGEVGSGFIYTGHVNSNPSAALAASADDTDNLNGITGGTGDAAGSNSSRVLYLKSGDTIWDFSGNVYEWTQQAIGTPTLISSNIGDPADPTFKWREWTLGSLSFGNLPAVSRPSTLSGLAGLSGATGWSSNHGIGQLYASYADNSARPVLRGGRWSGSAYGGVLGTLLNATTAHSYEYAGFRVAR